MFHFLCHIFFKRNGSPFNAEEDYFWVRNYFKIYFLFFAKVQKYIFGRAFSDHLWPPKKMMMIDE